MLKAMANFIRPATDRRASRHTKSRSPPPAEVARTAAHHQQQPPAPIRARRLSKTLPGPSQDAADSYATAAFSTNQPSPPARSSARKRSFAELDTPDTRLPSKIKQRRSHDDLNTPANGATKKSDSNVDHVHSGTSTPRPVDAAQTPSSMLDRKSLRSGDPSGRRATQLAEIFDDYETTIANWEEGETVDNGAYAINLDKAQMTDGEQAYLATSRYR